MNPNHRPLPRTTLGKVVYLVYLTTMRLTLTCLYCIGWLILIVFAATLRVIRHLPNRRRWR